ncbi:helix-turn-helix domain-containing protein [Pedobacter frigoris]|nr:helix-turn-helix domain-containing protein [Pedobacter frigoris]
MVAIEYMTIGSIPIKTGKIGVFEGAYLPPDLQTFLRLRDAIEQHFRVNRHPDYYLCTFGYTKKQMSALCRLYANKTLYELIQDRIHEEALKLLTQTTLSVAQVSYELGISSPSWFIKCFKKRTGMRPRQFRKNAGM